MVCDLLFVIFSSSIGISKFCWVVSCSELIRLMLFFVVQVFSSWSSIGASATL